MIEAISALAGSIGLGLAAGVNAYATMLVYGLAARFIPGIVSGDVASFFSRTPVLLVLAALYIIEFVADKIPAVDHVWDVIHTFIRPLAGAVVAFASVQHGLPHGLVILASVLGGATALGSHFGKASLRLASTATTGGAGNPVLSVAEDVFAVSQAVISVIAPLLVLIVLAAVAIVLLLFFARRRSRAA